MHAGLYSVKGAREVLRAGLRAQARSMLLSGDKKGEEEEVPPAAGAGAGRDDGRTAGAEGVGVRLGAGSDVSGGETGR